ncbi:hypothetical protein HYW55_00110 [Candidatus Gottesmanbacteria bacterium]|nr:hypothetical protein [Candidatus Gottesmanbacteria bacterium]
MKILARLPLYTGVSVFVLSILVTAVVVGQRGQLTNQQASATKGEASLSMIFVSPSTITVTLSTKRSVAGVDATIQYNPQEITIISSTLAGGPSYSTTGGIDNQENGTFSFSSIPLEENGAGIIASFTVQPKVSGTPTTTVLSFIEGGKTKVLEKGSLEDILGGTRGVTATL